MGASRKSVAGEWIHIRRREALGVRRNVFGWDLGGCCRGTELGIIARFDLFIGVRDLCLVATEPPRRATSPFHPADFLSRIGR